MGTCHPRKQMSRGDNFPCYPLVHSILNIILYWMLIEYIVYITFGCKTIQVKWIFEFIFPTPYIQTLIRCQSEYMVNRTRINSAQSIFFFWNITRCQVPSRVRAGFIWFSECHWFLSNVSQPIRINYFTWKYNNL